MNFHQANQQVRIASDRITQTSTTLNNLVAQHQLGVGMRQAFDAIQGELSQLSHALLTLCSACSAEHPTGG